MTAVIVEARTVSTLNVREHWSKRAARAKQHRRDAHWALYEGIGIRGPLPCIVTLTRIAPRALDAHDNLRGSLKAVVDAVADWLRTDDRDPRIEWRYAQAKGRPRQYAVRIEVEAA